MLEIAQDCLMDQLPTCGGHGVQVAQTGLGQALALQAVCKPFHNTLFAPLESMGFLNLLTAFTPLCQDCRLVSPP